MKRRLLLHVFFVSVAYYTSNGLYMVRGLVLAWLLGPAAFGVWTAMRLVQSFSHFAMLGSRQGMVQLAPQADGQGDQQRATQLRRAASLLNLYGTVALMLVVAAVAFWRGAAGYRLAWLLFAAGLLGTHLFYFYQADLRSHQKFTLTAISEILVALISTGLGLAAAWRYGLVGFLLVLGAGYLVSLWVVWRMGPPFARPQWRRETAGQLIAVGFPLMASGALCVVMWNVDKLLLWLMRGHEALGIYAVQASFSNVALLAPAAIFTVLHPHLMRHLGEQRSAEAVRPYLVRGGELSAVWSGPVVGLGFLLLHLPIRWWLARYSDAIEPGRVLMIAAYFTMMATVPATVLISLNGQVRLCLIRIAAIVVTAVSGALVLKAGYGYVALALAMSAGLVCDGLLTLWAAAHQAALRRGEAWRLACALHAPLALLGIGLALGWWLIGDNATHWQADLAATAGRCAILMIICAPYAIWRSHRLK
ncbi:MAG: oligosaccharide flippase family protein [Phycisphaeraceae bacterium]|nr:oligosaccharide flippase family protein [Phycisphaeraceae bacterium]